MGLKFRKSISLGGGVKLNINNKSIGVSAGIKGARVSINSKGRRTTSIDIPGTGVSYVSTSSVGKVNNSKAYIAIDKYESTEDFILNKSKEYKRIGNVTLIIAILLFIASFTIGPILFLISVVFALIGIVYNIIARFIKWNWLKQLKNK